MTLLNEHLEHQIAQLFIQSNELSSQRIAVVADRGQVRLEGSVQSFRRKLTAQQLAEQVPEVTSVINNLRVEPPDSTSDLKLTLAINHSLDGDARMGAEPIRVDSRRGTVTLSGYVSAQSDKKLVADIASSVDGVREINNLLIVNRDRVLANREHSAAIGAAISRIIGMENEQLIITVVDETARISGMVDSMWKKETAEQTVRSFGILTVCNDIAVTSAK